MPDPNGTFWSWLSAGYVADCWQPEMFRPEYVQLDHWLSQAKDLMPLHQLVKVVSPVADSSLAPVRWLADSEGIRRKLVEPTDSSDIYHSSTPLPEEAILVSRHWTNNPRIYYWNEKLFRGRGSAGPNYLVLGRRTDQSIAWICGELTKRESILQMRRAAPGKTLPVLPLDSLLNIRVRQLPPSEQSEATRAVRDRTAAELSQQHRKTLSKPFLLTAQTFEERLTQFERLVEAEGFFARSEVFFVEAAIPNKDSDLFTVRRAAAPSTATSQLEHCVPESDPEENARWRAWYWDDSPAESHRVFNVLASSESLPGYLLSRMGCVPTPPIFTGDRYLLPRFDAFRQAVVPSLQADVGVEDQVWAMSWMASQRRLDGSDSSATETEDTANTSSEALADDSVRQLYEWACHVYRPVLGLKVWRGESIAGVYLLVGDEQTSNFLAMYSRLDEMGVALSAILHPQSELIEDASRRESLRRLSWVMHQLNGPAGRALRAIEDLQDFMVLNPEVSQKLVPDEERARRRALMPGGVPLDRQTVGVRLEDAIRAVGEVRKIAYQVKMLKRVQGDVPKAPFSLSNLLRECCDAYLQQHRDISMQCQIPSDVIVMGSAECVREAINEVMNNSCRELRERKVEGPKLSIKCGSEQDVAWLTMTDNALPTTSQLISDPFEEDASTYASSGRGTGLGLTIVRETFRGHGGRCSLNENFESDGRAPGVTFTATLPLHRMTHSGANFDE